MTNTLLTRTVAPGNRLRAITDRIETRWIAVAVVALGVAARMLVALRGHNFDFDSYRIVAEIVGRGGSVYAETIRYNYGPIWFHILHALDLLALGNEVAFRFLLTFLLTLVDVGIFAILWRHIGKLVAVLFLLNPISIIITGYHSQFDNLAIFLGMLALVVIDDEFERPFSRRKLAGLLLLGISLATKHILFAFPLWLAVKQKGWWQKTAVLLIPVLIFLASFLPYIAEGRDGIIQNVFLYNSWDKEYFYKLFVPWGLQMVLTSRMVWLGLLIGFGVFARRLGGLRSLLIYTAVLVAASPSITNQYLTIPVAFVSAYLNPFTGLYTLVGTWYLLLNKNGLHFSPLQSISPFDFVTYYAIMVCLLTAGIVWMLWQAPITAVARTILTELRIQLRGGGKSDEGPPA